MRLHDSFQEPRLKATSAEEFASSSNSPVNISKLDALELDPKDYEKLLRMKINKSLRYFPPHKMVTKYVLEVLSPSYNDEKLFI